MKVAFIPATFLPIIGGAEIQCHNMGNEIGKKNKVDVFLIKKIFLKKKNYSIKYLPKLLIMTMLIVISLLHMMEQVELKSHYNTMVN